jgi:hypothetical protein
VIPNYHYVVRSIRKNVVRISGKRAHIRISSKRSFIMSIKIGNAFILAKGFLIASKAAASTADSLSERPNRLAGTPAQ